VRVLLVQVENRLWLNNSQSARGGSIRSAVIGAARTVSESSGHALEEFTCWADEWARNLIKYILMCVFQCRSTSQLRAAFLILHKIKDSAATRD
jgi:hypothetical protein